MAGARSSVAVQREYRVSDQLGHLDVATNGTRKVTGAEPPEHAAPEAAAPPSGQSVEDRLQALMEFIRTWDWRATPARPDPSSAHQTASSVSAFTAAAPTAVPAQPAVAPEQPKVTPQQPVVFPDQPVVVQEQPAASRVGPALAPEDVSPRTADPSVVPGVQDTQQIIIDPRSVPVTSQPSTTENPESAMDGTSSSPGPISRAAQRKKLREEGRAEAGPIVVCGHTPGRSWSFCA